ncbi:MAG: N-methyl-L-tryptophan oxidase [Planctomycetota bacterium]|nr:N-methyl-L-tryptophan oxidase [Planctomycetota bacterium]
MDPLDCIVLGTGGVGSAALRHLARRGAKVLGLDRFPPGHDRGSSHGDTRVIRLAYMEHPDYVPLLRRAYELWQELEEVSGETLYTETGVLHGGPAGGHVVSGVLRSAREHGLDVEELSSADTQRRFPAFRVGEGFSAVFEPRAGYLAVERCVRAHADRALRDGAELRSDEPAISWKVEGSGVVVRTERESHAARSLVVTTGAWAPEILPGLGISLEVRRKPLFWFATDEPCYRRENGCPVFIFETDAGVFYGFPRIDGDGVKVAEHSGGRSVDDPLNVDREVDPREEARVAEFLGRHLPGVAGPRRRHAVCLYTMTPDEHFVVDRHPEHPQVAFAAGLSGHGFKFTSVLGEILADLALDGKTEAPVGFLSCRRPALVPGEGERGKEC